MTAKKKQTVMKKQSKNLKKVPSLEMKQKIYMEKLS
jgi:hypothetical protein